MVNWQGGASIRKHTGSQRANRASRDFGVGQTPSCKELRVRGWASRSAEQVVSQWGQHGAHRRGRCTYLVPGTVRAITGTSFQNAQTWQNRFH